MAVLRRFIKQIIIAAVFLAVFFGVVIWIWSLTRQKPTCFDLVQNQNEEGVDCGGPCAISCKKEPMFKSVTVLQAQFFEATDGIYDVLGEIENKNTDFGADSFSYTFALLDASGTEIVAKKGASYILPREKKIIAEQRLVAPRAAATAVLRVSDEQWMEVGGFESANLIVRNKEFGPVPTDPLRSGWKASGVIVNSTGYNFGRVDIVVVLRDEEGRAVGAGASDVQVLENGQQRAFEVRWPDGFLRPVVRMDVEAYTNLLANENFLVRYGKSLRRFQQEVPTPSVDSRRLR